MLDGHTSAVNIVALMYVAMMIAVVGRQQLLLFLMTAKIKRIHYFCSS